MELKKELRKIVDEETVELFGIREEEFTDRLAKFVEENFIPKVNNGVLDDVSDTLIAWEQFKKANWYESEAIDVEKMLIDKFQAIYGR